MEGMARERAEGRIIAKGASSKQQIVSLQTFIVVLPTTSYCADW